MHAASSTTTFGGTTTMNRLSPLAAAARAAHRALLVLPALLFLGVSVASAAPPPQGTQPPAATANAAGAEAISLPHYEQPATYSEDLVIQSEGKTFVLKRHLDKGMTRTEFSADGHDVVMIELGDEKGTSYELMAEKKMAVKQSRQSMDEATGGKMGKEMEKGQRRQPGTPPMDVKVEDLGDDTIDSQAAKKLRLTYADGGVLAWFDKGTGAPLRMEGTVDGKNAVLEWKNRKVEPQPAALFEVPKDYELHDFDAMMAQMKGMGGMGGMMKGMVSGMTQGMGSSLGGSLGSTLGGSLAGPLGAAAGQYIGGKVGSLLGKKAADVVH
jgi:hypothetical protein